MTARLAAVLLYLATVALLVALLRAVAA